MDRLDLLRRSLSYYGLPDNYDRIFTPNGNGGLRAVSVQEASVSKEYSWIQLNLVDSNYPLKKPENKDIAIVHNVSLDFENPENPSLAHAVAEEFSAWLDIVFYSGIDFKVPVEDTGAGAHIVIPVEEINTKVYGGGDVVNLAVKLTIEKCLRDQFFHICSEHGVQMSLGAYDISRLLSCPGTYRPPSATKPDAPFLLNGYVRRFMSPYDDQDPRRVTSELLHDFIIQNTDEAFDIIKANGVKSNGVHPGGNVQAQHDQKFEIWLKAWTKRNPDGKGNKSDYFHRIVCAAYRRMRGVESVIIDHADIIDDLSGSKYGSRAVSEVQRSLVRAKQMTANVTTKSGHSIQDYIDALEGLGYAFRLNECGHDIEVNEIKLREGLAARICNQMYDLGFSNETIVKRVWMDLADSDSYHPVKEYLEACKQKYALAGYSGFIETLAKYFVVNEEITGPEGDKIIYSWLRKWLIGAVAKVLQQEQNPVLVLEGVQDIGKSTFARWLASSLQKYFIEQPINLTRAENDTNIRLTQKWIWEIGELGATTRRQDVEALKEFITRKYVTVRKPYGHHDVELPAMASFIGTINETGGGFLSDPTGNRRFIVAPIISIDFDYKNLDPDLIWGEAFSAFESGEDWHIRGDEIKIRDRINEVYTINEPLIEIIPKYFDFGPNIKGRMLSTEISMYLIRKRLIRGLDKVSTIAVGTALKKLGVKRRRGGDGLWFYDNIMPRSLSEVMMEEI